MLPPMQTRTYRKGFRDLIVWQESKKMAVKIFLMTKTFHGTTWHLRDQMNRAASSTMANIAEGSAMKTKVHRNAYFIRARGSSVELESFVELCFELALITNEQYEDLLDHIARINYLLTKLIYS